MADDGWVISDEADRMAARLCGGNYDLACRIAAAMRATDAAAYQRGRESVLSQLREPSEALVEAVRNELLRRGVPSFREPRVCRALAAALARA